MPLAPARFSTMTCCLRFAPSAGATMRQIVSFPPPGGKRETIRTGFAGYGCWPFAHGANATNKAKVERRKAKVTDIKIIMKAKRSFDTPLRGGHPSSLIPHPRRGRHAREK